MHDAHAALNAALNLTAGALLFSGWLAIRGGRRERHRTLMLAALVVSAVFLVSYVILHSSGEPTPFPDVGMIRGVYFAILVSHIVLAAIVPFLALRVVFLAWKERAPESRGYYCRCHYCRSYGAPLRNVAVST